MRSASIAEWILARFTNRSRAASTIGDLLEEVPRKGKAWFWLSLSGVVLSLTWRRPIAFAAAFYVGVRSMGLFINLAYGVHSVHQPPEILVPFFLVLQGVGTILSLGAAYLITRYGLKDSFVRQTIAAWALVVTMLFYWRMPAVAVAGGVLSIGVCVCAAMSARGRKALLTFAVTLIGCFAGALLFMYGETLAQNLMGLRGPSAGLNRLVSVSMLLTILILTSIYSEVHRAFFENPSGPEAQKTID